MFETWLVALPALLLMGVAGWAYAYPRDNLNIVDTLWANFFLVATLAYLVVGAEPTTVSWLLLLMVAIWAVRLSLHLAVRNAGKPEDRRYAAMRARHAMFSRRSLITVFGLQAVLAWLLSLPMGTVMHAPADMGALHLSGMLLFGAGVIAESLADWQLARFKQDPANEGRVLDTGLWRYSRHPNYFGEAVLWWGFGLFALPSGGLWVLLAPLAMTILLLRVSGVTLLERDIHERRPDYRRYIQTTSAFVPWRPAR